MLGISFPVFADTVDFTDNAFADAEDKSSWDFSWQGITVTVTAGPSGAVIWHDGYDGFGVKYSYENDEIEGPESLTLTFSSSIDLEEIYIADLFKRHTYYEKGWYQLDGGGKDGR